VLSANDPANGCILNIGPLEGGAATNVVPADAAAWGNARYFTAPARAEVERVLGAIATKEAALPRLTVEVVHNRPAKPATDSVQALASLAVACAAQVGCACRAVSTGGVSDANVLQHAGLPCLDGLGVRGGNLHRTDEFVVIDSLCERAAILALLIRRIMERPPVPCRP
jgi:glutamate carboxypeptidase